jgi:hypothetical protein
VHMDELELEERCLRASFEKMDDLFCLALLKAIDEGRERAPTEVSKVPGTQRPIFADVAMSFTYSS